MEPGHEVDAAPASSPTENDGLHDPSRQRLPAHFMKTPPPPRIGPESTHTTPEGNKAHAPTGTRRVPDRALPKGADQERARAISPVPEGVEENEPSGVEVRRIPQSRQDQEDSVPADSQVPLLDPRHGEPVREQKSELFVRESSWSQAPWVERLEGRRAAQHPPQPTVRISIGRVEVRAVHPAAPPVVRSSDGPRGPRLTLDDYLEERDRGAT